MFFKQFGMSPISQMGHSSVRWLRIPKFVVTPAQALLQPGIVPNATAQTWESVEVAAKQYGIYSILADTYIDDVSQFNIAGVIAERIAQNMARLTDRVVQDEVVDNITNILYASTTSGGARAANRAALTTTSYLFAYDIKEAKKILKANDAPVFADGMYKAVIHPDVSFNLEVETTTGGFIQTAQYSQPDKVFKGEIGVIGGVRLYESSNVKTYASTVTVYPTVVMAKDTYGFANVGSLESFYKPLGSGGVNDPINQQATVGMKVRTASVILQPEGLVRIETAAR